MMLQADYREQSGYDRTRGYVIGRKNIVLEHLEEAYTSENWLVRIYKVLKQKNRPMIPKKNRRKQPVSSSYSTKVCTISIKYIHFLKINIK